VDRRKFLEALMHIDCDTCEVRGHACTDCVVTFLLGSTPQAEVGGRSAFDLDPEEQVALGVLADSGLVPPLRLVRPAETARTARSVTAGTTRAPGKPDSGNAVRPNSDGMKSAGRIASAVTNSLGYVPSTGRT
jgi:hypothetical protein